MVIVRIEEEEEEEDEEEKKGTEEEGLFFLSLVSLRQIVILCHSFMRRKLFLVERKVQIRV